MVILGGLDLVKSSEGIETVSVSGHYKLISTSHKDIVSRYQKREKKYSHLSLKQFFEEKKQNIIPHFVGGSGQPCYPVSESYARTTLLINRPWSDHNPFERNKDWKRLFE